MNTFRNFECNKLRISSLNTGGRFLKTDTSGVVYEATSSFAEVDDITDIVGIPDGHFVIGSSSSQGTTTDIISINSTTNAFTILGDLHMGATGNIHSGGNILDLPTSSGQLALTAQIPTSFSVSSITGLSQGYVMVGNASSVGSANNTILVSATGATLTGNLVMTGNMTTDGHTIVSQGVSGLSALTIKSSNITNISSVILNNNYVGTSQAYSSTCSVYADTSANLILQSSAQVNVSNTTNSTSTNSGALTISGGVGIAKTLYASSIVSGGYKSTTIFNYRIYKSSPGSSYTIVFGDGVSPTYDGLVSAGYITPTISATLGTSILINKSGIYNIIANFYDSASPARTIWIDKNTNYDVSYSSVSQDNILATSGRSGSGYTQIAFVGYLSVNDVVRIKQDAKIAATSTACPLSVNLILEC